jgi:hypothetical protein
MKRGWIVVVGSLALAASAQVIDNTDTRVQTTLDPGLTRIGTLRPKSVAEIGSSRWTLGCETIDREYSDYHAFKVYLPPLGIRRIRLQGGWARTEKTRHLRFRVAGRHRGRCPVPWSGDLAGDRLRQSGLSGRRRPHAVRRLPEVEEGLQAWDRWVEKMAEHYRGRVRDWAMWNEPDGNKEHTPECVTRVQHSYGADHQARHPDARIGGLVLCGPKVAYFEHFARTLAERNQLDLFHWVVYHAYSRNPDDHNPSALKAKAVLEKYAPGLRMWQGECGTQSEWCPAGALSRYPWTELTQAKWDARRMLAISATARIPKCSRRRTSTIEPPLSTTGSCVTASSKRRERRKLPRAESEDGLLCRAEHRLRFQRRGELIPDYPCEAQCAKPLAVYGHRDVKSGRQICVFWDKSGVPSNRNDTVSATLTISGRRFRSPCGWTRSRGASMRFRARRWRSPPARDVQGRSGLRCADVYRRPLDAVRDAWMAR